MVADRNGGLWPAGGMRLSNGEVLVAAYSERSKGQSRKTGGVFGQKVGKNEPLSDRVSLDQSAPERLEYGGLLVLKDKRGLSYWQDLSKGSLAGARFIAADGTLAPDAIDLRRPNSFLTDIKPYETGFIASFIEQKRGDLILKIAYQIFDGSGRPAGPLREVLDPPPYWTSIYSRMVGLNDGGILILQPIQEDGGLILKGQVLNGDWSVRKQFKKILDLNFMYFQVVALPGGDFAVGTATRDQRGTLGFDITRFTPALDRVGDTARIQNVRNYYDTNMIALETGKILAITQTSSQPVIGQLIEP